MRPRRVYEEEDEETEGGLSSRRQQDFIVGNDKALLAARLLIIALHVCVKIRRNQMEEVMRNSSSDDTRVEDTRS